MADPMIKPSGALLVLVTAVLLAGGCTVQGTSTPLRSSSAPSASIHPTTASTDHSREFVPLLTVSANVEKNVPLGTRATMADIAAMAGHWLGVSQTASGNL